MIYTKPSATVFRLNTLSKRNWQNNSVKLRFVTKDCQPIFLLEKRRGWFHQFAFVFRLANGKTKKSAKAVSSAFLTKQMGSKKPEPNNLDSIIKFCTRECNWEERGKNDILQKSCIPAAEIEKTQFLPRNLLENWILPQSRWKIYSAKSSRLRYLGLQGTIAGRREKFRDKAFQISFLTLNCFAKIVPSKQRPKNARVDITNSFCLHDAIYGLSNLKVSQKKRNCMKNPRLPFLWTKPFQWFFPFVLVCPGLQRSCIDMLPIFGDIGISRRLSWKK